MGGGVVKVLILQFFWDMEMVCTWSHKSYHAMMQQMQHMFLQRPLFDRHSWVSNRWFIVSSHLCDGQSTSSWCLLLLDDLLHGLLQDWVVGTGKDLDFSCSWPETCSSKQLSCNQLLYCATWWSTRLWKQAGEVWFHWAIWHSCETSWAPVQLLTYSSAWRALTRISRTTGLLSGMSMQLTARTRKFVGLTSINQPLP